MEYEAPTVEIIELGEMITTKVTVVSTYDDSSGGGSASDGWSDMYK